MSKLLKGNQPTNQPASSSSSVRPPTVRLSRLFAFIVLPDFYVLVLLFQERAYLFIVNQMHGNGEKNLQLSSSVLILGDNQRSNLSMVGIPT